jgi:hypothetical protein
MPRTTLLCARTIAVLVVVNVARTGSTLAAGALTVCLPIFAARRRRRRAAAAAATLGDGHPRHAHRQPCGHQNRFPHAHRNHLALGASPAPAKLKASALRLREDIADAPARPPAQVSQRQASPRRRIVLGLTCSLREARGISVSCRA